jgi:hypothetical protein
VRLVLLILCAVLATAQEDHSQHHHAVAGLGTVALPTSCNATAQKLISRGAALLHSFGYEDVGGGEKVCHFAGQKGAGGVVSRWPIAGAPQGHYVYDGLSSEGFTCGAR